MNKTASQFNLWLFQQSAKDKVLSELKSGNATLLVSPTGSGKTVMASEIAKHFTRVLFVAHRQEIIDQARASMGPNVTAVGIQSVMRHGPNGTDLLIIDEAHRSAAKTYRELIERYPEAARLGLTATPLRTDGKGLSGAFSVLVEAANTRDLISLGRLVPYRSFEAPDELLRQLATTRKRAGDYDQAELSKLMNRPRLVGDVVREYKKNATGRKSIAFAVSVEHSIAMTQAFNEAGVRAAHLDGRASDKLRREALAALRSGKIDVLSNVNLFTEGWDCPEVSCVIVARPTMSLTLHLQSIGRGMRACEGKNDLIILDHAGNIERHGLPDAPRVWSLESDAERATREAEVAELERLHALGFDSIEAELEEKQRIQSTTYLAGEVSGIVRRITGKSGANSFLKFWGVAPISGAASLVRYLRSDVDAVIETYNSSYSTKQACLKLGVTRAKLRAIYADRGISPVRRPGKYRGSDCLFPKLEIDGIAADLDRFIGLSEASKLLGLSRDMTIRLISLRGVSRGDSRSNRHGYSRAEVDQIARERDRQGWISISEAAATLGSSRDKVSVALIRLGIAPKRFGRRKCYLVTDIERLKRMIDDSCLSRDVRASLDLSKSEFHALLREHRIRPLFGSGAATRYSKSDVDLIARSRS
jgi:superfamily II DNA or RNA helicase